MTVKTFSPHKYLFIMTLTVSIKQCEKANLFKPNTPKRQKHRFVSHSSYCPVVRLKGLRAYIRILLYVDDTCVVIERNKVDMLWDQLNSLFPGIHFTRELEQDYQIAFLDERNPDGWQPACTGRQQPQKEYLPQTVTTPSDTRHIASAHSGIEFKHTATQTEGTCTTCSS